jgi:hypothetical protein
MAVGSVDCIVYVSKFHLHNAVFLIGQECMQILIPLCALYVLSWHICRFCITMMAQFVFPQNLTIFLQQARLSGVPHLFSNKTPVLKKKSTLPQQLGINMAKQIKESDYS